MSKLFFVSVIIIIPFISLAQTGAAAKEEFTKTAGAEIYNGKIHTEYLPAVSGVAYYLSREWQAGSVMYHEIYYPSVWLKYDLVQKELIIQHLNGTTPIILFTPRLQYFSISGKKFIRVNEKNDSSGLPPGIYEEGEKGRMSLYINRSKSLVEEVTPSGIEREFLESDGYYMVKDHIGFKIGKQKDIWKIVKGNKASIKHNLKRKGLNFRQDPESTLAEIASYYNETNK